MSHEVPKDEVQFVHDGPTFEYDRIYKCFPKNGNGLLFRLVNTEKRQWAFYNDTEDTNMVVNASFGSDSMVKALRRTRMSSKLVNDKNVQCATLEVEPLRTELFIEGTVSGFSLEFESESAPSTDVQFTYRRPTVPYDDIYKCFKNRGNGLLFRLVDRSKSTWYFYNDTREFNMMVTVEFSGEGKADALGKTTVVEPTESSAPNSVTLQLTIEPGKTEPFMTGDAKNYKLAFSAEALDAEKPLSESELQYKNGTPDPEMVSSSSKVYKCFKDHDNGLLFRIVDEKKGVWAFYNDTTDYMMNTIVRFPESEKFEVMPDATAETDPEDANTVIVKMQIPPTTTRVLIRGLPETFSIGFSAESAEKPEAEKAPHFVNGEPNREVIDYTEVYRCFKSSEIELLYRLVDANNNIWGFYNDTKDKITRAKVAFANADEITALGKTHVETDEEMGTVHVLDVSPQATELFVKGEVTGFKGKYSASECK